MIKNIIARRYSRALLEIIDDKNLSHLEEEIVALQKILNKEPIIREFLVSPIIENYHKSEIVELLLSEFMEKNVLKNFMNVLIEKERIFFIDDILKELISQIHSRLGIYDFDLITAHEIDEKTRAHIQKFITKYVDGEVLLKHKVDSNIRGGFLAYNDELAINASIRNNLDALKRKF